jgi:hypothetical protein
MAQGSRTPLHVRRRITRLVLEYPTASAAAIRGYLEQDPDVVADLPSPRTVEYLVKQARPADPSGTWSFARDERGDAQWVLPALAAVIEVTQGRRRELTVQEAEWVARIRRAVPSMPGWDAYQLARLFMAGGDPRPMEAHMAFEAANAKPRNGYFRYLYAARQGWVDGSPIELGKEVEEAPQ